MPVLDETRLIRHRVFDMCAGTNVRTLRMQAGMEQRKLAELVDIDVTQLSRVENGQRSLKFKEALAIAEVFGVRPDQLARPLH
jgi:transcriptional regulator with XRE-family HTH domain